MKDINRNDFSIQKKPRGYQKVEGGKKRRPITMKRRDPIENDEKKIET